ncbi:hypothetical protein JTE90_028474 [Oedothorax gibbosus]|uniref:Uncharacterized protein n=1 Tax=Oedothorax gibbosus TaxID=931172 RepID=A0AAV6TG06_9ARAC|nr:hypothetical protein JTE90_028474 [Oedothorax gibbosus]
MVRTRAVSDRLASLTFVLDYGNIPWQMLSHSSSCDGPRNFTSSVAIRMPPSCSSNLTSCSENQQIEPRGPMSLFHAPLFESVTPALSTLIYQVNLPFTRDRPADDHQGKPAGLFQNGQFYPPFRRPPTRTEDPTTSFLTATTVEYTLLDKCYAAAGTWLALHLILR